MKSRFAILLIMTIIISCNKDYSFVQITDFSEEKKIEVKPYKLMPYSMLNIRVRGVTNDTIIIRDNFLGENNYLLSGKIDTMLVMTDYYGEVPVIVTFIPFKANSGKIEIEVKL